MKVSENGATAVNLNEELGKAESSSGVERAPFTVEVAITGVSPILFHRWDCAAVKAKGKAKKNSHEKKTDNLESYVYRCDDGTLGFPGINLHMSMVNAAKSKSDPRSPRKSAADLTKAVILVTPTISSFGVMQWDFEDSRRVTIQRAGITRTRPAMREGWKLRYLISVLDSSYMDDEFLYDIVASSGRYVGIGDFRPQFGRFNVTSFERVLR